MKAVNMLLTFFWKFTKVSFRVTGIIMNYIAKEAGRVTREAARPSNPPRIWWW